MTIGTLPAVVRMDGHWQKDRPVPSSRSGSGLTGEGTQSAIAWCGSPVSSDVMSQVYVFAGSMAAPLTTSPTDRALTRSIVRSCVAAAAGAADTTRVIGSRAAIRDRTAAMESQPDRVLATPP